MKHNKINFCHSAHYVLLSIPFQVWVFLEVVVYCGELLC